MSCLKSVRKTDLPCLELFERKKRMNSMEFRAAHVVEAGSGGGEKEVIQPIVLIC